MPPFPPARAIHALAAAVLSTLAIAGCDREAEVERAVEEAQERSARAFAEDAARDVAQREARRVLDERRAERSPIVGAWQHRQSSGVLWVQQDGTWIELNGDPALSVCWWGTWSLEGDSLDMRLSRGLEVVHEDPERRDAAALAPRLESRWRVRTLNETDLVLELTELDGEPASGDGEVDRYQRLKVPAEPGEDG